MDSFLETSKIENKSLNLMDYLGNVLPTGLKLILVTFVIVILICFAISLQWCKIEENIRSSPEISTSVLRPSKFWLSWTSEKKIKFDFMKVLWFYQSYWNFNKIFTFLYFEILDIRCLSRSWWVRVRILTLLEFQKFSNKSIREECFMPFNQFGHEGQTPPPFSE